MQPTLLVSIGAQALAVAAALAAAFLKVKGRRGVTIGGTAYVVLQLGAAGLFGYHQMLSSREERAREQAQQRWQAELASPLDEYTVEFTVTHAEAQRIVLGESALEWRFFDKGRRGNTYGVLRLAGDPLQLGLLGYVTVARQVDAPEQVAPNEEYYPRFNRDEAADAADAILELGGGPDNEYAQRAAGSIVRMTMESDIAVYSYMLEPSLSGDENLTTAGFSFRAHAGEFLPPLDSFGDISDINAMEVAMEAPPGDCLTELRGAILGLSLADSPTSYLAVVRGEDLLANDPWGSQQFPELAAQLVAGDITKAQRAELCDACMGAEPGLSCTIDTSRMYAYYADDYLERMRAELLKDPRMTDDLPGVADFVNPSWLASDGAATEMMQFIMACKLMCPQL